MAHVSVYVTCPDEATARRIGRAMVEQRLAACANVFPIASVYRWEGRLVEESEVAMLLKTRQARLAQLIEAVKATHPYDVPCIVALPWESAHAPYRAWVDEETT